MYNTPEMFKRIWLLIFILLACSAPAQAQGEAPLVLHLTADGALTPAMKEYLIRGLEIAQNRGAEALIFQLDTPITHLSPGLMIG